MERRARTRGHDAGSGRRPPTLRTAALLLVVAVAAGCSGPALPDLARATAVPALATAPAEGTGASGSPTAATGGRGGGSAVGADVRILEFPPGSPVAFTTGPGDLSWSVSVTADDPADLVGIRQVTDPTGAIRYLADLRNELLIVDELHPVVLADAAAVGLYVTAPTDVPLETGTWTIDVVGNAADPTARVAVRSGDPSRPQVLDLVVWVTAEVAAPEVVAAAWRQQMDALLAPHDIRVGALDLVQAGEVGRPYAVLGVDGLADEVHRACTAAAEQTGARPRTAVLILAEQIGEGVLSAGAGPGWADGAPTGSAVAYRQPDGRIDGFAVATPGTPVLGPASHACVAVSAGEDPSSRGSIALHEVLHQAGITRHTTEQEGRDFDSLPDTAECPAASFDVDGDRRVSQAECADADGGNLMFWAVGGSTLTRDQAWRVRTHPLLHPDGG